jgi:polar amino acid transport system permease protein
MTQFTLWDIVRNLLFATRWTVVLSLVSFVGGGLVGGLVLFLRIRKEEVLRRFAWAYIEIFQGTPLLMQLFLAFFGLGLIGIDVPAWLAAGTALILWTAAFFAEIWRGCVESIAKGQWEASSSLGMGYLQQMRYVILPQALKIAIPPTVGFSVQVVNYRLCRIDQSRNHRHQRHLPAVHRLRLGGAHLFRPVLAAVEIQPVPREEAQWRSSKSLTSGKASATTRCSRASTSMSSAAR